MVRVPDPTGGGARTHGPVTGDSDLTLYEELLDGPEPPVRTKRGCRLEGTGFFHSFVQKSKPLDTDGTGPITEGRGV